MKYLLSAFALVAAIACNAIKDGEHRIEILTTNDVHGRWFDSSYVDKGLRNSLLAVNYYVDSVRKASGTTNVLLVDAGDCLQGDNASYYFNYVDTDSPHLFPRLASYMKYDAITVGNHDIEAGHKVYDRVTKDLSKKGIPFLGGNAIRTDDGMPYFPVYKIFKKGGFKIAVLGFTNPNIKAWLTETLWEGMHFESLIPIVQNSVDEVREKEKPDVVVVSVHSGTGKGDGSIYENQGLDLLNTLRGVDFLICSHDHSAYIEERDSICLINSGSHAKNVGHGVVNLLVENGKIVSKSLSASLIGVKAEKADPKMRKAFRNEFEAIKRFTLQPVGKLESNLLTRESYTGMCDYMNLLHTISLSYSSAGISFAAPLTYNDEIKAGTLLYNDLFKVYPFENQLFVIKMTGEEIKKHLEFSYENWINTISSAKERLLKIKNEGDMRFNQKNWSFVNRPYNFDSAAGINYTVDVTKPFGERVLISTLADGRPFSFSEEYKVAMTSYRANGGGGLISEGAGINTDLIEERIVEKSLEIRNLLYEYIMKNGKISPEIIGNPAVIGSWRFVPEKIASEALKKDMELLF